MLIAFGFPTAEPLCSIGALIVFSLIISCPAGLSTTFWLGVYAFMRSGCFLRLASFWAQYLAVFYIMGTSFSNLSSPWDYQDRVVWLILTRTSLGGFVNVYNKFEDSLRRAIILLRDKLYEYWGDHPDKWPDVVVINSGSCAYEDYLWALDFLGNQEEWEEYSLYDVQNYIKK